MKLPAPFTSSPYSGGPLTACSEANLFHNFEAYDLPVPQLHLSGQRSHDLFHWMKSFEWALQQKADSYQVRGIQYHWLFEEGLLNIPLLFEWRTTTYALFLLYDERAIRRFRDARQKLQAQGISNILYLSSLDLQQVCGRESCLEVFGMQHLALLEQKIPAIDFREWWPSSHDAEFLASKSALYLEAIHQSMHQYESYFIGHLLSELKVPGFEKAKRIPLPEQNKQFLLQGPEHQLILLSMSKKEGVRFRFPAGLVSQTYRERFLDQLQTSLQAYRLTLTLRERPSDCLLGSTITW